MVEVVKTQNLMINKPFKWPFYFAIKLAVAVDENYSFLSKVFFKEALTIEEVSFPLKKETPRMLQKGHTLSLVNYDNF